MLALVYARVSTEEQAERGSSLDDQVSACEARARLRGATQVEVYRDVASGGVLHRPGLDLARRRIAAGGVGLFVCLDPDRLARNLSHQLLLTEEFERAGVRLEFVNFEWRDTPEGRLFYALRGAIAEYEKEKIRERTIRGKIRRAEEKRLTHNPRTYGYVYRPEEKTLSVDPAAAEVVRQVFRWYVHDDVGYRTIAQRLNEMNLPSPRGGAWTGTTVRRIIANTAYSGLMYLRRYDASGVKASRKLPPDQRVRRRMRPERDWIPVPVPAIVDPATFRRAADKRAMARRLYSGGVGAGYLLGGLAVCGLCGRALHGCQSGRRGRKRRYYVCLGRSRGSQAGPRCALPFIPADLLEALVWRVVVAGVSEPRALERAIAEAQAEALRPLEAELRAVDAHLADCDRQRSRAVDLCQRGIVTVDELASRLKSLAARTEALASARASLQARMGELLAGLERAGSPRDLADEMASCTADLDFGERRALVRLVARRVAVGPDAVLVEVRTDRGPLSGSGVGGRDDALRRGPVDQDDADLRKNDAVE